VKHTVTSLFILVARIACPGRHENKSAEGDSAKKKDNDEALFDLTSYLSTNPVDTARVQTIFRGMCHTGLFHDPW
jgi:hypothetical protein